MKSSEVECEADGHGACDLFSFPLFTGRRNVISTSTLCVFPVHSLVLPREHLKCYFCFALHIAPSPMQKKCIVRALSLKESATSDSPVTDVQEALRRGGKKGNTVSSSKKIASVSKKTGRRKKNEEKIPQVADNGSDGVRAKTRKKISESQDKNIKLESDGKGEDDEDDFEYDWPPLVCCFGAAQYEFIPTVRISDRQMDPDMYSTWKGLQWSPPEFVRAPGGPPSNVAIALVRLGGRAAFMGKVGDDPFGYQMVRTMNEERVQTRGVKFDPLASTAVSYMKLTRQDGRLGMKCIKPCAEDSFVSSEINIHILKEARMFHFNAMPLAAQSTRSSVLAAIKMSKKYGGVIFFDVNLPLPLWRSRDETRKIIQEAWNEANVIEVTKQELEFLLDEDYFEKKRNTKPQYYARSISETKRRRENYHYTQEEILPLWHDNIKILFVTDGTFFIHYYTPTFDGTVTGTEDVLVTPFTCDRTGSGDALVAGIIRKLTIQPELYNDQVQLEKQLRFAICAGIIAQWTIGGIRGFPTESAAQNLKEQVYVPSMW
eukprot:Gb_07834 [translate_table: standard]